MAFDFNSQPSDSANSDRYTLVESPNGRGWAIMDLTTGRPAVIAGRLLEGMSVAPAHEIFARLIALPQFAEHVEPEPVRRIIY